MKELYKALADFQQGIDPIYKGTEGYGYSYADWGQILEVVNPILKMNGLGFTQLLNGTSLTTRLFHIESDTFIESTVDIPQDVTLAKMNTFQVMGSAITYYKRYALSAMLGLVTDKDADAAGEQVKPKVKATPITRNRTEEAAEGSSPMGEDILTRAKSQIKDQMIKQEYTRPDQMKAFIKDVLKKETIDSIDDANLVADALDNEKPYDYPDDIGAKG